VARTSVSSTGGKPSASIGERIRIARDRAGLTRAELGRRVGVRPSASRQWEQRDATTPSVTHLAQIAAVTGVAFEWLATGRGSLRLAESEDQPVLVAETFARDAQEERLLDGFRRVVAKHREHLVRLVEGLSR
jgi:transcriptional regulator with XRE-family HTH domain